MKPSKYKSKKVEIDGIMFDSKIEGKYYSALKIKKRFGEIKSFKLQPVYELQPKFNKSDVNYRNITLKADFEMILKDGSELIVDIKGYPTETAKLKKKLFDFKYPDKNLIWLTYSKIDGGWIEYEDLKKARKLRKKAKVKK
ncbi:MAG: DUF1064 domain-containing protein [Desulfobacula sp.]|nr:DUF1064 domain-containing protein [Desulfobacula sp.]